MEKVVFIAAIRETQRRFALGLPAVALTINETLPVNAVIFTPLELQVCRPDYDDFCHFMNEQHIEFEDSP